jgi:hypothetical protein
MQLPSDPGALVMTTPAHGGCAQPASTAQMISSNLFIG